MVFNNISVISWRDEQSSY